MEAISAILAATAKLPDQQRSVPYTSEVYTDQRIPVEQARMLHAAHTGPPFSNPAVNDTAKASHEACVFALNATVGKKLMYFCDAVSHE